MRVCAHTRDLVAVPLSHEINDVNSIWQMHHTAPAWAEQVADSAALLARERDQGGRVIAVTTTPWLVGQPHRIPALRKALDAIRDAKPWMATAGEIADVSRGAWV